MASISHYKPVLTRVDMLLTYHTIKSKTNPAKVDIPLSDVSLKPRTVILSEDLANQRYSPKSAQTLFFLLESQAADMPMQAPDLCAKVAIGDQAINMFLRRPLVVTRRRTEEHRIICEPERSSTGAIQWYYDEDGIAAMHSILRRTIPVAHDALIGRGNMLEEIRVARGFNNIKTPVSRSLYDKLMVNLEGLAQAEHQKKFGESAEARYARISQPGAKPENWPESDVINVQMDNHTVALCYGTLAGRAQWLFHNHSRDVMSSVFNEYEKSQLKGTEQPAARNATLLAQRSVFDWAAAAAPADSHTDSATASKLKGKRGRS